MEIRGREYQKSYDAIIVGSGIGGLCCANLLAQAGMNVLVIEQHYVLGGFCSTFRRKGFTFDAATHFYPLLGNPSTFPGRLLKKLGIETRWIKMDPVDRFHFPGGETFVVPADFDSYLKLLKTRFPEQEQQIERFFEEVKEAYLYGLLFYFRDVPNAKAEKYLPYTVQQKLDEHFQDPKLKAVLVADHSHWGSLPGRTSFLFDSMLRLAYFLGNYYPQGSSQVFADDLGRALKANGGDVLLYTQVEEILVRGGRAQGVVAQTRSNRHPGSVEFQAPVVISNADALQTYSRLIGEQHCGSEIIQKLRRMRPTHPVFLLHLGLRGMERSRLQEVEGYYWTSWDPADLATTFFKVFFPTLLDPSIAPPGHDILIVQKWHGVDYDDVEDWQVLKEETEEYVMSKLRALLPGLDDRIVVQMSATAQTSYRYTLNHQGAMLGWEMSPDQLGWKRPSIETSIENLYLVGHWTQPGGGVVPVLVSAQRAADKVLAARS